MNIIKLTYKDGTFVEVHTKSWIKTQIFKSKLKNVDHVAKCVINGKEC